MPDVSYNQTVSPNIGSEFVSIIGIGPGIWPVWQGTSYLAPYFQHRGLELESYDASNWSAFFGGGVTIRAIVRTGFNTLADADEAAHQAMRDAGFDVQGHTNVPLASVLPDYPPNEDLGEEDQYPAFLDGLAKQLGVSKSTLEIVALVIVGVVVFAVVKK